MRRLWVFLALLVTHPQAARADDPTGQPAPASTAPAPTPASPTPGSMPVPPDAPPAASPGAAPSLALRPSPGPVADPTPRAYPSLDAVGAYEHDGLFLRFLLGPSTTSARTRSHSLSGSGTGLGVALGYAVRPGVVLQLDVGMSNVLQPDEEVDGAQVDRDLAISSLGLGPGATYYFSHNLFATAAVHVMWLRSIETREIPPDGPIDLPEEMRIVHDSRPGIGASAAIGKEWWISPSWGLGVAGRLRLGTMGDAASEDSPWRTYSLSLLVSATMN